MRLPMLRIDESAKTLVAPDAAELVPDEAPSRDELHALISAGWSAFAAEIGLSHVIAVAPSPAPGIDLLAVDANDGRPVIVTVADGHASDQLNGMLASAAFVSSWDADRLGAMHEQLKPSDSPKMVLVGAEVDEAAVTILDWLGRHAVTVAGYGIEVAKRGAERMMTVQQTYPAPAGFDDDHDGEPDFFAAVEPTTSAPPPPPPAAVEA